MPVSFDSVQSTSSVTNATSQNDAFRDADFLSIMLSELTNQDPMKPSETSEIVDGMRKLQELANAQYGKFRDDLKWGQDLMGQTVTANQANLTDEEYQEHLDRGLQPARGFGLVTGEVEHFRVIGQNVWVRIDDKDYQIDNIQTIVPDAGTNSQYAGLADSLLGRKVDYYTQGTGFGNGVVDRVSWDDDGAITLDVNGEEIPFESIRAVSSVSGA